ncbi:DUF397 domain-containing protein [Streptomyces catenulae]|uniref:DUF397 domain-containing protein n=1 Tax=Streptomyces catenulae TaxID=66875 RepID=A0ABV2Z3Q8_9ACTN|nr:DUF397 domain-containing protein [Streptomyces catenulae]
MTHQLPPQAMFTTGWRKSSYSDNQGASCVEIHDGHPTAVPVRDSKNPHGPALLIPVDGWAAFVRGVKNDDLVAC